MKLHTLIAITLLAFATAAFAGSGSKSFKEIVPVDDCRFKSGEVQVDAFGAGGFYKQGKPGWGGGLGLNYFITKHIGVGVEQDILARNNGSAWGTFGNLVVRYPICSWNVAPYAVAGVGTLYGEGNKAVLAGTVGGGLEYRVTKHVGLFGDARWLYNNSDNSGAVLGRTGLRFSF